MKKQIKFLFIAIITLVLVFLIIKPSFTGNVVFEEKISLGYCPTIFEEAKILSEENDYELIKFDSASEVLYALKNNLIDKALIGRKAEKIELNKETKEIVLKSGYTLVSNKKGFIDNSQIHLIEIYSYTNETFNFSIINVSKEEVFEKILNGSVSLISWDDWNDDFELIVVMDGTKKVKDFRGVFLYEFQ